jgi:hypothetical protein
MTGATGVLRLCAKPVEELQHRWWLAWFWDSAGKYMRTAFVSVVMQRVVVFSYRRFGATYRCDIAGVYPVGMCHFFSIWRVVFIDCSGVYRLINLCRMLSINSCGISSVSIAVAYHAYRLFCLYRFVCLWCILINKWPWCELNLDEPYVNVILSQAISPSLLLINYNQ